MIIQEKREAEIANENEEDDDCSEHVTEHFKSTRSIWNAGKLFNVC